MEEESEKSRIMKRVVNSRLCLKKEKEQKKRNRKKERNVVTATKKSKFLITRLPQNYRAGSEKNRRTKLCIATGVTMTMTVRLLQQVKA